MSYKSTFICHASIQDNFFRSISSVKIASQQLIITRYGLKFSGINVQSIVLAIEGGNLGCRG